ncbi:hypothetical protein AB0C28_13090 [Nonomuraea sp. NPDC048892]|uniref:hypothetical protein n=1 Tax=Nonomuraea sp. NPDC048892 TaxID=3154624 RepID=UPI0033DD26DF
MPFDETSGQAAGPAVLWGGASGQELRTSGEEFPDQEPGASCGEASGHDIGTSCWGPSGRPASYGSGARPASWRGGSGQEGDVPCEESCHDGGPPAGSLRPPPGGSGQDGSLRGGSGQDGSGWDDRELSGQDVGTSAGESGQEGASRRGASGQEDGR